MDESQFDDRTRSFTSPSRHRIVPGRRRISVAQRTAVARLINGLLVVAMLVSILPPIGLRAAPVVTVPVDASITRGDTPRAVAAPAAAEASEEPAAAKDRKSKRKARSADAGDDRGKDRGKDQGKDRGKNQGKDQGKGRGKDQGKAQGKDQGKDLGGDPAAVAEPTTNATTPSATGD